MTREQIQYEGDRPLPCAAQEAFRCRPDAMSDDEKTILSAIVLQKGEAEAAEIFRESPEHLRDYTILKGVNSYAALGRYYLANETTVPEELYEYIRSPTCPFISPTTPSPQAGARGISQPPPSIWRSPPALPDGCFRP